MSNYYSFLVLFDHIQGVLAGFDQRSDIVLSNSIERVYSMDEGVEEVPLGLYLVKGDQMYALSLFYSSLFCVKMSANRLIIN